MKRILMAAAALLMLAGCAKNQEPVHVVVFGLDGWGAYCVEQADMPNIRSLMENGAYTLQKRTMLPSHSATNWATQFMGVGPQVHGFTKCCSPKADMEPIFVNEYGIFPTIFRRLRDQRPEAKIGMLYDWKGLAAVVDTLAFDYREFSGPGEEGRRNTVEKAGAYIQEMHPDLLLVYFGEIDHVGHSAGHDTPEYYKAVKTIDMCIGDVIQSVKDAGIYDNTVFVVTSDHGGIGLGHGGINPLEMETPFVLCGKGIKKLGNLNKICVQVDVAPTLAAILGINMPADEIWGRPLTEVLE